METTIKSIIHHHASDPTRLLDILLDLQNQFGYLSAETITQTADLLDIPVTRVQGVVAFYNFLYAKPVGRYRILLSNCIIDTMHGALAVMDQFCQQLGIKPDQLRSDGKVSIAETSCSGFCDQGPAALINGVAIASLNSQRIASIVNLIENDTPLKDWPAELFQRPDNIQLPGYLLKQAITPGSAISSLLSRGTQATLDEIEQSALRGCGGAGFPTASKWRYCRDAEARQHYVVCNADEGEPGTFKDRVLLNQFADQMFEGMTICARIIGARQGFVYLRGEYLYLKDKLQQIIDERTANHWLGNDIAGVTGFDFEIKIRLGAGAYICGEESALLESLEGKRGIPRIRPPFPVTHGYLNQPTVVNNVETFATAAKIALEGSQPFNQQGTANSPGSRLLSVAGDCTHPGIYEYPFGTRIDQILDDCRAENTLCVQIGGPSGTMIAEADFHRHISFEDLPTGGSFIVFNGTRDPLEIAGNFVAFFAHENCGFCTPCRVGTTLMKNTLSKINSGSGSQDDIAELHQLCELISKNSHCGLGQTAPNPVMDTLACFAERYQAKVNNRTFTPDIDLEAALQEARQLTGRDDPAAHLDQFNE
ncbi:MAG: NAD(P)H-dependent oxidoreductase subunit E [Gammaproteobacteria bacterium]|nr:NAD(P)H-dependent oxidoreductase subunit E [Gammaproteobacteria bacterium]